MPSLDGNHRGYNNNLLNEAASRGRFAAEA